VSEPACTPATAVGPGRAASPRATQAALIAAMAIWGLNVTAVKALTAYFDPTALAAVRMVTACAALAVLLAWRRCRLPRLDARQALGLAACAVLMVYANQILFAEGLLRSTATNGALIMALSPLVSALLAVLAFGERLSAVRAAGVALGFGGVAAVVLSHPGARLATAGLGDLLLALAVISFAAGGVIVQRLARHLDPLPVSCLIYLGGTLLLVAHAGLADAAGGAPRRAPDAWAWTLVLFSGVLATAVGNLAWNAAIARIGVARTSVFLYWVPVFGVLFAALLLGERLTPWHAAGFAGVMGGTWLGTRRPPARPASSTTSQELDT